MDGVSTWVGGCVCVAIIGGWEGRVRLAFEGSIESSKLKGSSAVGTEL